MSRPEANSEVGLGDTITLDLAPPFGAVEIRPICGSEELWLAGRRRAGLAPVVLETLVLRAGMVRGGGDPDAWRIGDRNRILLAVLCVGYGVPDEMWVRCTACDELHELPFDPGAILSNSASVASTSEIGLRLPSGADLAACGGDGSALRDLCAPSLSIDAFEAEIASGDPCAELRFALTCVSCNASFYGALDPLALLLAEIDLQGGVLAEIDALARAYHWAEADLLDLPAWRRRLYMGRLTASADRLAS